MRSYATAIVLFGMAPIPALAQTSAPPVASMPLLKSVDLTKAVPLDEDYRRQFAVCDGEGGGGVGKDSFRGHPLPRGMHCSSDPNRVHALAKLADGGIYWQSKMALDVDGSWVATSGRKWTTKSGKPRQTTDQCGTSLKWRSVAKGPDCKMPDAQVDPDAMPFIAIPAAGAGYLKLPKAEGAALAGEFRRKSGLANGDMGVVIYGDRWAPAFIADAGPFFRLGEGSARIFTALDRTRCTRGADADGRCVGDGGLVYPYSDAGIGGDVVYVFYPGTGGGLTKANAIARICEFAARQLNLTGSSICLDPARQ